MRKYLLALWLAVTLGFAVYVWAYTDITVAPSAFTISSPTNTTLACSWTIGATGCDSVNIIRLSGSDSLFLGGNLTNTATSKTLTGLTPNTQYILALRVRRGDSTAVSNKDTVYTSKPNLERWGERGASMLLKGARAWRASSIDFDSLYISTDAGLDSTMSYWASAYTSIQAKGIGDSSKVKLLVFSGHAEENTPFTATSDNNTGAWNYNRLQVDSLSITDATWTKPRLLNIEGGDHFYIRADGQTDNGNATKVLIRLFRRD